MDLFKGASMKMATSLDWNCKTVCKRHKKDTQRIHKRARAKLKKDLQKLNKVLTNGYNNDIIKE